MHPCLQIPEIASFIFGLVYYDSVGAKATTDILALASTCFAFQEIALDILWHTQVNFVRLIKILPSVIELPNGRNSDKDMKLTRVPTDKEMARFLFYTRRIRRLVYAPHALHSDSQDLLMLRNLWNMTNNKTPMFPNLRRLEFPRAKYATVCLDIFLQTTSISLSLISDDLPAAQSADLFQIITDYALGMQELDIGGFGDIEAIKKSDLLSSLICQMPDLRGLSCGSDLISSKAIHHLATLPRLRKLQIPCSSGCLLHAFGPNLEGMKYFPALQVLELYEEGLSEDTIFFIRQMRPLKLQKLVIRYTKIPVARTLHDILRALEEGTSHLSLTQLTLKHTTRVMVQVYPFEEQIIIDGSILQPLLSFPNLRTLELDIPCTFELGDASLHDMAKAWPRIRRLQLGFLASWGAPPAVTLSGILDLLVLCPEVDYFFVPFNASVTPPWLTPASAIKKNITYLQVGNSDVSRGEQKIPVARFLKRVFPNLCGIGGEWLFRTTDGTERVQHAWDEVVTLTKSM